MGIRAKRRSGQIDVTTLRDPEVDPICPCGKGVLMVNISTEGEAVLQPSQHRARQTFDITTNARKKRKAQWCDVWEKLLGSHRTAEKIRERDYDITKMIIDAQQGDWLSKKLAEIELKEQEVSL